MSETKKPIALDETLRRLVEAILSQNASQRELRDLAEQIARDVVTDDCLQDVRGELEALNGYQRRQTELLGEMASGKVASEICFVPVVCTAKDDGSLNYELDGITFDDILGAYEDGKFVILRIVYGENVYFATFVDFQNQTVPIGSLKTLTFFAHTLSGEQKTVQIYRLTKKDGSVENGVKVNPSGLDASQISCKMSVGGVEYNTLDAVLGAIVAALG